MSFWRRQARVVCDAVRAEWHALPVDEQTEQRLISMLRAAYPFLERQNWPYDAWLIEQRFALSAEGYPSARQEAVRAAKVAATGQLSLLPLGAPVAVLDRPEPASDGWDAAFEDLRRWKRLAWTAAEGDEDGAE